MSSKNYEELKKIKEKELAKIEGDYERKKSLDVITLVLIFTLVLLFALLDWVGSKELFSVKIQTLLPRILSTIPVSLGIYSFARISLVTKYGMNFMNKSKIKEIEERIQELDKMIELESEKEKVKEKEEETSINLANQEVILNQGIYPYQENVKVKKLGSLKK